MKDKFWNEMMKALTKDGEKLRQLTGEDHGPWDIAIEQDMWLTFPKELTLNEKEKNQVREWSKNHNSVCPILKEAEKAVDRLGLIDILELPNLPFGPIGGSRTFSLTPTSIGSIITVECPCGEEFPIDNNL